MSLVTSQKCALYLLFWHKFISVQLDSRFSGGSWLLARQLLSHIQWLLPARSFADSMGFQVVGQILLIFCRIPFAVFSVLFTRKKKLSTSLKKEWVTSVKNYFRDAKDPLALLLQFFKLRESWSYCWLEKKPKKEPWVVWESCIDCLLFPLCWYWTFALAWWCWL